MNWAYECNFLPPSTIHSHEKHNAMIEKHLLFIFGIIETAVKHVRLVYSPSDATSGTQCIFLWISTRVE